MSLKVKWLARRFGECCMKKTDKKRLYTVCEANGAEFLVMSQLMIRGIWTYKTYVNMPGYDLLCTNKIGNKVVRVQVKSRTPSNAGYGIQLSNNETDFVVYTRLNRGFNEKSRGRDVAIKEPEFWILPIELFKSSINKTTHQLKHFDDYNQYKDNWKLIMDYVE